MAALKSRAGAEKTPRVPGAGELREILEADFLREVTGCRGCVVHFYHAEFTTCAVMDKHLRELAAACPATRFLRIDASKAPFFVTKLRVQVRPTLLPRLADRVARSLTACAGLAAVRVRVPGLSIACPPRCAGVAHPRPLRGRCSGGAADGIRGARGRPFCQRSRRRHCSLSAQRG